MINIIIAAVFGAIIGVVASNTGEPKYIEIGGIFVAVLITYPIQMAIQIFI